jgi:hypothetical protein
VVSVFVVPHAAADRFLEGIVNFALLRHAQEVALPGAGNRIDNKKRIEFNTESAYTN